MQNSSQILKKLLVLTIGISTLIPHFAFSKTKTSDACNTLFSKTRLESRVVHSGTVNDFDISPDGSLILTGSDDRTAQVSDSKTGTTLLAFGHPSPVKLVAFSPDQKMIVTAENEDNTVRVLALDSKKIIFTFKNKFMTSKIAFSPDSKNLLISSNDGLVNNIDLKTGSSKFQIKQKGYLYDLAFSNDGKNILACSLENTAKVADANTGETRFLIEHEKDLFSAKFSPDSSKIITTSLDGKATLTEVSTGKTLHNFQFDARAHTDKATFTPDSKKVIFSDSNNSLFVIDVETQKVLFNIDHDNKINSVDISKNGRWLISTYGLVKITDLNNGKTIFLTKTGIGPKNHFYDNARFLPDGVHFLSHAEDESNLSIWRFIYQENILNADSDFLEEFPESEDRLAEILDNPACKKQTSSTDISRYSKPILIGLEKSKKFSSSPQLTTEFFENLHETAPYFISKLILKYADQYETKIHSLGKNENYDFKKALPTKEQALKIIDQFSKREYITDNDAKALLWLIQHSTLVLDREILNKIHLDSFSVRADIEDMLKIDPSKYTKEFNIAAIKFSKALLAYSPDEIGCSEANSSNYDNSFAKTLGRFTQYGNDPRANKYFYAQLLRVVLEKQNTLCSDDRNLALRSMKDWEASDSRIQYEIVMAVKKLNEAVPFQYENFSDALTLSQLFGYRKQLQGAELTESIRAFGSGVELDRDKKDHFKNVWEEYLFHGMQRFILGNPEGVLKAGETRLKIAAYSPTPMSIVRLCRLYQKNLSLGKEESSEYDSAFFSGAHLFLNILKESLEHEQKFPVGFTPNTTTTSKVREILSNESMSEDLIALESNCEKVSESKTEYKKQPQPKKKKARKKSGDFNPRGR